MKFVAVANENYFWDLESEKIKWNIVTPLSTRGYFHEYNTPSICGIWVDHKSGIIKDYTTKSVVIEHVIHICLFSHKLL